MTVNIKAVIGRTNFGSSYNKPGAENQLIKYSITILQLVARYNNPWQP